MLGKITNSIEFRFRKLDDWSQKRVKLSAFGLFLSGGIAAGYMAGMTNVIDLIAFPAVIAGFEMGHVGADFTRKLFRGFLG